MSMCSERYAEDTRFGFWKYQLPPTSSDFSKHVCGTPKSDNDLHAVTPLTPAPITHTFGRSSTRILYAHMRVAVVDIGTNSTRLLIAEVDPDGGWVLELVRRSEVTRLGARGDRGVRLRAQPRRAPLGRPRRSQQARVHRLDSQPLRARRADPQR